MSSGKPAGQRCVQLDDNNHCRLFHHVERPQVCVHFQASADSCGRDYDEAVQLLSELELLTR
jgi:hypothetical protein